MNARTVGYFALIAGLILVVHMLTATLVLFEQTEDFSWHVYVQAGLRIVAAAAGGFLIWGGWRRIRLAKAQDIARDAARRQLEQRRAGQNGDQGGNNSGSSR